MVNVSKKHEEQGASPDNRPHRETKRMKQKRGFTLIELLVVIAVIAILAAILCPVFAQVRIKGRRAACLSNLKQIGIAALMYAQDYDETILPWQTGPLGYTPTDGVWTGLIQPYLKNGGGTTARGVLGCPNWSEEAFKAGVTAPDCAPAFWSTNWPPREIYSHYSISAPNLQRGGAGTLQSPYSQTAGSGPTPTTAGGTSATGAGTYIGTTLGQVLRPAETMHFMDGVTILSPANTYGTGRAVTTAGGCAGRDMHHGGVNMLFFDGHSRWIKGHPGVWPYLKQNAQGEWFRTFMTYSME